MVVLQTLSSEQVFSFSPVTGPSCQSLEQVQLIDSISTTQTVPDNWYLGESVDVSYAMDVCPIDFSTYYYTLDYPQYAILYDYDRQNAVSTSWFRVRAISFPAGRKPCLLKDQMGLSGP